ncbi:kinase-like protein [Gigaspora margarita]|uniref:Kinase-like protein n=1 Tax=Gigaspora margarita TaxID=4874 RepID=A0A8H4B0P9_GIGMA|nr:kinase-like protein [Gigaspora margarita]
MQYADSGTLKNYLKDNILELDHKISLCKDIAKGLEFLHKETIIHRDLHSKNVLIHRRRALLADFGLSKSLLESKGTSDIRGIQAYVDPKSLENSDYTHGKFSDIYSFGVLMWEIYTCTPPFDGRHDFNLTFYLCNGLRENRQVGMPWDYVKIYEKCWNPDPAFRPADATEILNDLEILKKKPTLTENDIHTTVTEQSYHNNYSGLKIIIEDTDKMQDIGPTNNMQLHLSQHHFEPLFNEVYKLEEIRKSNESNDNVQLNKIMYEILSQCILEAKYHVKRIHIRKSYLPKFVTLENYTYFKNLVDNLKGINKFMENISHIKGLKSFIQNIDSGISCELLKTEYSKLLEEYHKSMSSLGFTIQKDDQAMDVHDDVEETEKIIQALQYNFNDRNESMFDIIHQISDDMQNSGRSEVAFKKYICHHQKALKPYSPCKNKYNKCSCSSYQNNTLDHQVFLNNLKSLMNMTEFYGIIQDETYPDSICTEWSEHGNLRTYYMNHSNLNNLIKLKIALDICNGLLFLNEVNFLHRNIRSENILITSNLRAKIINFCHSRLTKDHSKQLKQLQINCTGIEYVAPEIIERNTYTHTHTQAHTQPPTRTHANSYTASTVKYNFKCEIYSFGILLWELANQKPPYEDEINRKDLNKIISFIHQNKKNFNNSIPEEYAEISIKATNEVPKERPTICDMHEVLYNLVNDYESKKF